MLYGLNNKKLKYILLFSACVIVVVSFGVFFPKVAQAGGLKDFLTEVIGNVLYFIAELLGRLLVAVIQIFIGVIKYNDFGNADAVAKGWVIVRDVCNMFFITVLLMIAFGTIFQWEIYRYNRLLGRFILMAFLINFSKFIALFLIDFSQVIMMTFVNAFSGIAAGNLVNAFGLQEMFQMMDSGAQDISFSGVVGALILAIILLTIAIIVMVVMAIVLLMRIIVLWILIILSPFAFLARTWPGAGERTSAQWWTEFGKYLTVGPVIAFFLWLSLTIMTTTGGSLAEEQLDYTTNPIEQSEIVEYESQSAIEEFGYARGEKFYAAISKISSSDQLLSYIIAISLLIGSLMVANKMSVAGGQFAGQVQAKIGTSLAKVAKLGAAGVGLGAAGAGLIAARKPLWWATKKSADYGERKLYEHTGVGLSPKRIIGGIKETFEKRKRDSEIYGAGKAGERLQKGGWKGLVGGLFGAPRDWSETYLRGFMAHKGIKRAAKTVRGGPEAMERVEKEMDEEKEKLDELKGKSKGLTEEEKGNKQDKIDKHSTQVRIFDDYAKSDRGMLNTRELTREMRRIISQMIVEEKRVLTDLLSSKKGEMEREKDPEKKEELKGEVRGLEEQEKELNQNYQPFFDISGKVEQVNKEIIEAQTQNDTKREDRAKRRLERLEGELVNALPSDLEIKPGIKFGENIKLEINTQKEKLKVEIEEIKEEMKAPTISDDERKNIDEEIKKSSQKIEKLKDDKVSKMGPQAFYALRERRLLQRKEASQLDTTNEDELIYMFKEALESDDKMRAQGVIIQAARAAHLNEILNAARYNKDRNVTKEEYEKGWRSKKSGESFTSDQQGMSDFFEQIMIDKLGMEKQEALSLQNDVSNIAETNHHWAMGQSVGVKNGQYVSRSPFEQGLRCSTEMVKQDPETIIRRANRLGYGGETVDPETGTRAHTVGIMGLKLILHNWPGILNNFVRNRFNKSAAENLSTERNMKILQELGSLLDDDDDKRHKYTNLDDKKYTEREAFSLFLKKLKEYAIKSATNVQHETEQISEVLKKGLSDIT